MTLSQIKTFLELLGVENARVDENSGWVRCSCPLAQWTHDTRTDRHPSFGVKMPDEGLMPGYHCFSCGSQGNLVRLIHVLQQHSRRQYSEASGYLAGFAFSDKDGAAEYVVRPDGRKREKLKDKHALLKSREVRARVPVPDSVLAKYPELGEKSDRTAHREALLWLTKERKITLPAIRSFQLRLYEDDFYGTGVVFPVLSGEGDQVLDLWVRLLAEKKFFRLTRTMTKSPVDYQATDLWFGQHLFKPDKKRPLILVEGALDALRLHSLGVRSNVFASLGQPSREQLTSFHYHEVYCGFDADGAGLRMANAAKRLVSCDYLFLLDWSLVGKKDPGALEDASELVKVWNRRTLYRDKSIPKPAPRKSRDRKPASPLRRPGNDGMFL